MSLALTYNFSNTPWTLDYPFEVEIVDDNLVNASRVHRECVLNIFSERYSIDLVLIPMRGSKVIAGMDWLVRNGSMIDCEY